MKKTVVTLHEKITGSPGTIGTVRISLRTQNRKNTTTKKKQNKTKKKQPQKREREHHGPEYLRRHQKEGNQTKVLIRL